MIKNLSNGLPIRYYLINLVSRPDRLEHALRECDKVGISPIIYKAIYPDHVGEFSSCGARGCYESHCALLEMISKNPDDGIHVIIEDDFFFSSKVKLVDEYLEMFWRDRDKIDLLYFYETDWKTDREEIGFHLTTTLGTHFYTITTGGARKILEKVRKHRKTAIDIVYKELGINRYATNQALVNQNYHLKSDISNSVATTYHKFIIDTKSLDPSLIGEWYYSKRSHREIFRIDHEFYVHANVRGFCMKEGDFLLIRFPQTHYWEKIVLEYEGGKLKGMLRGTSWDGEQISFVRKVDCEHESHLNVNIIRMCNMSCTRCDHFSSLYGAKDTYDYLRIVEDLRVLAKYYTVDDLWIIGGEPLLHPNLKDFLVRVRGTGISNLISITTNGKLLDRVDDELISLIDCLHVSLYPSIVESKKIDLLKERLTKQGKGFTPRSVGNFNAVYSPERVLWVQRNFNQCKYIKEYLCRSYDDGYFYLCSPGYHINRLQGWSKVDGLKIRDSEDFKEDLHRYLRRGEPLKACENCRGACVQEKWGEEPNKQKWKEINKISGEPFNKD